MTVRTVTVLFTDLVGSTRLLGALEARRAESLRSAHVAALRTSLEAHGGVEVKTLGDGIMAVFDSAGSALACAAAMQRAVTARRPADEPALAIRIGISAGDATGGADGDWHGPAVVEASRLCGAASGGEVLVSDVVVLLARGGPHALTPAGRMELKGIAEPVMTHELVWAPDEGAAIRVLLAEDAALVREGIARLLEVEGFQIVSQVGDADSLVAEAERLRPDVVVSDIRMPPTGLLAGLSAAEEIVSRCPGTGVLLLSNSLQGRYARRLLAASERGVGYLSKDRVGDMTEFAAAVRTVAGGGTVFDPLLQATES